MDTPVICPASCKLETDKVLLVLFHARFGDCKIDVEPLPIKTWFDVNVVVPIPPLEIDNVPNVTFEVFKEVKPAPEPTKLVDDKVLVVLSHVKFGDCKIDVVEFPIKIWFAVNVVVPIPPRVIDNVPDDTFEAFKEFNEAPEPVKRFAVIFVADIVVPVKSPDNVPPVKGKNNDNVEVIATPFLYISPQLILFNTYKA